MSSPLDLSIIVVAYNGAALLRATLDSVARHTRSLRYETIVVDSASPDPEVRAVAEAAGDAHVRYVRSPRNAGFAAANNLGLRLSSGRYVALLNPDTLLHADALSALIAWLDAHPAVGAAAPMLVRPDGTPQPYSYGAAPSPGYLVRRRLAALWGRQLHAWHGGEPRRIDWAAATCLVVRRAALEEVGPLDEQFFLYFEDVDWGVRLSRRWPVMFVPGIAITHVGGGSVGPRTSAHYDRSLVRFYAKHYGGLLAAGVWAALRLYRAARAAWRR